MCYTIAPFELNLYATACWILPVPVSHERHFNIFRLFVHVIKIGVFCMCVWFHMKLVVETYVYTVYYNSLLGYGLAFSNWFWIFFFSIFFFFCYCMFSRAPSLSLSLALSIIRNKKICGLFVCLYCMPCCTQRTIYRTYSTMNIFPA